MLGGSGMLPYLEQIAGPACKYIEVGTRIAPRPPHRSRRAVLLHRALHSHSPRTGQPKDYIAKMHLSLSARRLSCFAHSWFMNVETFEHPVERLPAIAPLLAASIQP